MNAYEYAAAHEADFLAQLQELLRIPSVSTSSAHAADVRRAAEWLRAHLQQIGLGNVALIETPEHHPLVYGEWLGAGPNAPTVLLYGHYDVQPADPDGGVWTKTADPFEPVIADGNIYARGATDDKGQAFAQLKALESLLATGALPVNVKVLLEGEEESGSGAIELYVREHPDRLACDVVVVSDSHILSLDRPSILTGLRGIVALEVTVTGPKSDLHSGMYGGAVHNPAQALAEILAALHDDCGRVAVPGFYDHVRELSLAERAELAQVPYTAEQLAEETGAPAPWGEHGYQLHERTGIRPTLEINGLTAGWQGEGSKTIIPQKASAKITCRLVPNQDPDRIGRLVAEHIRRLTPPTVTSTVNVDHAALWAEVDPHSPYMEAAARAYEHGFGAPPVFVREGGSIPIVATFQSVLGAPVILMGFGLPDDNLHAPDEKLSLECFRRGIKTAIKFYEELRALPR